MLTLQDKVKLTKIMAACGHFFLEFSSENLSLQHRTADQKLFRTM